MDLYVEFNRMKRNFQAGLLPDPEIDLLKSEDSDSETDFDDDLEWWERDEQLRRAIEAYEEGGL